MQPTWIPPSPCRDVPELLARAHPVFVTNSLTRQKERFVPKNGRQVYWYSCGPTVYDSAHMGHARTYLTFDIMQRILKDYFNYDVVSVMNVTDIDDKIINRSQERGIPFSDLSRQYENEFFEDLETLGCRKPDIITRVTEYLPEVQEMIQKIVENGYGYVSNGSVYFDVSAFQKRHPYGKLVPENVGSEKECESLGVEDKHNSSDFALWKAVKPGEPSWPSAWGPGRPGWHIECSAMSVDCFKPFTGGSMDVHSGGVDLRFPHHDNEMAQSEAYLDTRQSINYFLHTGHLNIDGLKMSKSLKNFITIRQALELNSSRQIRLCFLYHKWNATINYSDGAMEMAATKDKFFNEFFLNVKSRLRGDHRNESLHFTSETKDLFVQFNKTKNQVHESFCSDFDTKSAMESMESLIRSTNKYLELPSPNLSVLDTIAKYVSRIFSVVGLIPLYHQIGFPLEDQCDRETLLHPYLDVILQFRDKIRAARNDPKLILSLCDVLRDDELPLLGVRVEDKETSSVWKLADPEVLKREREEKLEQKRQQEDRKRQLAEDRERERLARLEKGKEDPKGMFRDDSLYSAYDETGIPTLDSSGAPVAKSAQKKLKKLQQTQEKLHEEYLKSLE